MLPRSLLFGFLVETGIDYVGHAGLELSTSDDPPASASQSIGITGVSHCAWPKASHCINPTIYLSIRCLSTFRLFPAFPLTSNAAEAFLSITPAHVQEFL